MQLFETPWALWALAVVAAMYLSRLLDGWRVQRFARKSGDGKLVVVTGAGSGIGLSTVRHSL